MSNFVLNAKFNKWSSLLAQNPHNQTYKNKVSKYGTLMMRSSQSGGKPSRDKHSNVYDLLRRIDSLVRKNNLNGGGKKVVGYRNMRGGEGEEVLGELEQKLNKANDTVTKGITNIEQVNKIAAEQLKSFIAILKELLNQKTEQIAKNKKLISENEKLLAELESKENALKELEKTCSDKDKLSQNLTEAKDEVEGAKNDLQAENSTLKAENFKLKNAEKTLNTKIDELQARLDQLDTSIVTAHDNVNNIFNNAEVKNLLTTLTEVIKEEPKPKDKKPKTEEEEVAKSDSD